MRPPRREQRGEVAGLQPWRQRTHHHIVAPIRHVGEMRHHRGALLDLADAFERLVPLAVRTARQIRRSAPRSSSISRPNVAIRRCLSTNGASARKTKRHFGQSQHQLVPRRSADWRNAVLQLRNTGKYAAWRAKRRAMATSDSGRSSEKYRTPVTTCRSSNRLNACSNSNDLLYWWFTPCDVGRAGGMLVRHRDRIEAMDDRAGEHDHAEDAGDRHVPIERARLVQREQRRIQPARHADCRQPGLRDRRLDRRRVAQREQHQRFAGLLQAFDRHDGILAAADRHAGEPRQFEPHARPAVDVIDRRSAAGTRDRCRCARRTRRDPSRRSR